LDKDLQIVIKVHTWNFSETQFLTTKCCRKFRFVFSAIFRCL